jgi:hypothetical protein
MDDERRNRRMMHDERADAAEDEAPEPPGVARAHDDEPVPAVRQLSIDRMLYAADRTGAEVLQLLLRGHLPILARIADIAMYGEPDQALNSWATSERSGHGGSRL